MSHVHKVTITGPAILYVEADSKAKAEAFAGHKITSERLTTSEVIALVKAGTEIVTIGAPETAPVPPVVELARRE